ncbi:MAG: DUF2275 domain-containing protein [Deltaproteobacteria bacterium]|nr:DUF2275 domain-containing protein [Deltaproteobacteria bacterium]
MTCNEIENQLPAYIEELLSPEEKKAVAGHLAACDRCSRALAELERAGKLVRELEEVEPPPFFEQRIMSRVREEAAGKQGILRRLFYPLHSKIPVPALATIVVAVLAYHVYQQGVPEMKQVAPLPARHAEQDIGRVESRPPTPPATPPAARPSKVLPAPAGDLAAVTSTKAPPVPPVDLSRAASRPYVTPPPEERPLGTITADSQAPKPQESLAVARPAAPVTAKEKDARTSREEVPSAVRDQAVREEPVPASETFAPELKREKAADAGAASGDNRKAAAAPAPARMKAAMIQPSAVDLMIQVRDPAAALRELESYLARVNARIIERRNLSGSEFWKVEMAATSLPQLLSLLEGIGRVTPKTDASTLPAGQVTLGITMVALP